jgi:hypothetical protein
MRFTLVAELCFITTHKNQIPNPVEFVLVNYGGQIIHRLSRQQLRIYFADRQHGLRLGTLQFYRHTKFRGEA